MAATIRLQREPFDAAGEAAKLRRGRGVERLALQSDSGSHLRLRPG